MSETQTVLETTAKMLEEKIRARTARVGIVGLGYVGLPLAVEFAKAGYTVTGIDVSEDKTRSVNAGESYIGDISSATLAAWWIPANCAPPPIFPRSASWTPSTSASPRRCARPKIPT